MNMLRPFTMQIRREFWEHRGIFVWLPVFLLGLITLAGLIFAIGFATSWINVQPSGHADPAQVGRLIFSMGSFIYGILAYALVVYLVGTLYSDRRNGSVLFWRSLPVSDTRNVLGKVITAGLVGPAFVWLVTVAASLLALVMLAVAAGARGAAGFSVFSPLALFGAWGLFAYAILIQFLWWLPYIGWLLFASAAAPRAPFLWAVLPPVIAGLIELIALRSSHLFSLLAGHLANMPIGPAAFSWNPIQPDSLGFTGSNFDHTTRFLTLPSMWIGVGIGVILIALAVIARRYTATR